MGVIALGIGFANPLATAGVVAHVAGHALAKSLGFYAAMPLLRHVPGAHRAPLRGIAAASPASAAAVGVSLGRARGAAAVAAVRERAADPARRSVRRRDGGDDRRSRAAGARVPRARARADRGARRRAAPTTLATGPHGAPDRRALTVVCTAGMLVVTVLACLLPGSQPIELLMRGVDDALTWSGCRPRAGATPARTPAAGGARLRCLFAADGEQGPEVRALLGSPGEERLVCTAARAARPSRASLEVFPAVGLGRARGARRLRHPLRRPRAAARTRRAPGRPGGLDDAGARRTAPHQVAVGPIHAGVIESGHFRFHVVGERILHLDLRLFYKHRGLAARRRGPARSSTASRSRSGPARPAPSRTRSPTRRRPRPRSGLRRTRALRRARTLLLRARAPLQPPQRHLGDLRRDRLRARHDGVRRAQGTRPAAQRAPHGAPLPVRHGRGRGQPCELDEQTARFARATSCERSAPDAAAGWREMLFAASVQDRLGGVGVLTRPTPRPRRRRTRRARRRRAPRRPRRRRPALVVRPTCSPRNRPPPPGTSPRALEIRAVELQQTFDAPRRAARPPAASPHAPIPTAPSRPVGVGRVESPRGETVCVVEPRRRLAPAPAPAHRLLRELAGARAHGARQPAAGLPTDQQELRALLRLRGPLAVFFLLRHLQRLRRELDLPAPRRRGSLALRHVDAGSCNGCEHELTAAANPVYDLQRFGLNIVASPRHADVLLVTGAGHDAHGRAAARGV